MFKSSQEFSKRKWWLYLLKLTGLMSLLSCLLFSCLMPSPENLQKVTEERLVERGQYLATIGVCEACHTPPAVSTTAPSSTNIEALDTERLFRTSPDWFKYLDSEKRMAGGVPFILRLSSDLSGVVYTRNITPDPETGIGNWTTEEIVEAIRTGKRKDDSALFLFPPHSFFSNLTEEDALALAIYLQSLPPIYNPVPERSLPFPVEPATDVSNLKTAPEGRTPERASYLMNAIVGCRECHSHYAEDGSLVEFVGGNPIDPFIGVFRLGPDLPLRSDEKGFAAFPYPGYAIRYGPNLTRFGIGGDLEHIPSDKIIQAIRNGISTIPDDYGRPSPLGHIMMWQFYANMSDDDAYAIADYIKNLEYIPNEVETLILYGDDWEAAFKQVFGEAPSANDRMIFGKAIP